MTSLGDWVYRTLTGRTEPAPLGPFLDQLTELRAKTGSVAGTARAAGLPRRTVRYWFDRLKLGKVAQPKPGTLEKLSAAVRASRLSPARPGDTDVVLNTRDRYRGTPRTIRADQLGIRPGTMDKVAAEWVRTGDPEAAAAVFLKGVGDSWYRHYLTPATGDDRTTQTVSRTPSGDEDEDEDQDEEDDGGEDWPYDDLSYEEVDWPGDEGYGGDVE